MAAQSTMQLQRQRFRMRALIRTRLWAQVMAGMVLGLATGFVLGPDTGLLTAQQGETLGLWLALPGQLFLGLIAMVLMPLIFASIVGGLAGAASGSELKAAGLRFGIFVLGTTVVAAWTGIVLALWLEPGAQLVGLISATPVAPATEAAIDLGKIPGAIASMLPRNPGEAIVSGDMLAVVVLALLVGIAATQIGERARPLLALLDTALSISLTVVKWAMFLAPYAVFGLMAQLVMRTGIETVIGMSAYVGTVLLGLALVMAMYLAIVAVGGGMSPRRFLEESAGTLLLAFSTSSSSAVMPMTIAAARRLGVPDRIANLVVPLGATLNMAGTALYQSVAILFLAQMAGVEMGLGKIALISTTLIVTSLGAPGTPGVSIAILMSVAAAAGIPAEGVAIILGVDRLLDMCRTAVNVAGDLVASLLLRHLPVHGPEPAASHSPVA